MAYRKTVWLSVLTLALALAAAAPTAWSAAQPPSRVESAGPVVIRLYIENRADLDQVAGELDIWEVHYDLGYAVAAVEPYQIQWLQDLGYRVEIDPQKTTLLGIEAPLNPQYYYFDHDYVNSSSLYVVDLLQGLATTYPGLVELIDIGNAWQANHGGYHRDIWVLRITNEAPAFGPISGKPAFFLFANIHAREVATAELAIRYIEYLTSGYNGQGSYSLDPDVTWLVDHNVAYFLVMQNPDGHRINEANIGADRRKNLDDNDGCTTTALGVDLNRNHSFKWGCCGGSSGTPCSDIYRGPSRGSEPETAAFESYFATVMPDQNGLNGDEELPGAAPDDATGIFISLHSYSDLVLWPWGFSADPAPNNAQLQAIGRKLAYYNSATPSGDIYTVDGTTDDWTYGKFGVASFSFEVGPNSGSCGGFFPAYGCLDGAAGYPRNFWGENRLAFIYAHKIARTPYKTVYGPDTQQVAVAPTSVLKGNPLQLTANIADHRYTGDPLQPIAAAEYFVDAPGLDGAGTPLVAGDGDWGGTIEAVQATVDTSDMEPGRHYILVHGQNSAGAWGPFTAVFVAVTSEVECIVYLPILQVEGNTGLEKIATLPSRPQAPIPSQPR